MKVTAVYATGGVNNKNSFKIKGLENLGDDLMHYQRMFSRNGEGYAETLRLLQRTGATLTQEQIDASKEFTRFAATVQLVGEGMQNNFLEGFVNQLPKDDSWLSNVKTLDTAAKMVGEEFGKLTVETAKATGLLINVVTGLDQFMRDKLGFIYAGTGSDTSIWDIAQRSFNPMKGVTDAVTSKNDEGVSMWDNLVSMFEKDPVGSAAQNYALNGETVGQNLQSFQSKAMMYQVNPTFNVTVAPEVGLTLQSDVSRLSDYIDFNARASASSFTQSLTLSTLSGQSNTGG